MDKRILGKTGFEVSILGFGGIVVDQTEQQDANNYVSEAIDLGINYFDVAPSYGRAQYILGPALEPYRKKAYLACKTEKRDAKSSQEQLIESLRALKTDYFDVYQFHALDNMDEIKTVFSSGGAMETMIKAKDKGLIRNIGFTCHTEEAAFEIMRNYNDFSTVLFPINWAYWLNKDIGSNLIKEAKARNMGIIAIKGLAHRKWLDNEDKTYPKCWYKPIYDDDELADLAFRFTLTRNIDTAISPGDIRMLRKAYEILKRYKNQALSEEELGILKAKAMEISEIIF
jgi:Predicted oxidoreductases of the aldo/keto reductase family